MLTLRSSDFHFNVQLLLKIVSEYEQVQSTCFVSIGMASALLLLVIITFYETMKPAMKNTDDDRWHILVYILISNDHTHTHIMMTVIMIHKV